MAARTRKPRAAQPEFTTEQLEAIDATIAFWDQYEHDLFLIAEAERILAEEAAEAAERSRLTRLCHCGCGETPVGKTARFIPGHDGRLKGRLLKEAREGDETTAAAAVERLKFYGWEKFLVETVKSAKKRRSAEKRAAKEAEQKGEELPKEPSALTPEDRARIAAIRAKRAGSGMRDMTSRQPVNA